MSLGGILIGLALLVVIAPLLARPFLVPVSGGDAEAAESPPVETVLAALRDLDFDHQAGKVTDDDYEPARAELLAQAAQAMKKAPDSELEDLLELKVREVRKHLTDGEARDGCPHCGGRISPEDRFCSRCGRPLESRCPTCGRGVAPGDAFCTRCGRQLQLAEHPGPDGSSRH